MKRFEISLLVGMVAAILIGGYSAFASQCDVVRDSVIRVHILANSDSQDDQQLKLAVRDSLLSRSDELFGKLDGDKELAELELGNNLSAIEQAAQEEIIAQGYSYPVKASLVNMYFETREYESFTLPAGYYDAVRITIGEAKGKNWWCVMFPPMCLPAATKDAKAAQEVLGEEGYEVISQPKYKPAFAIVEWFEGIKQFFS